MSDKVLYFDCFSGAAGDMILGALVAVGAPLEDLAADIATLPLPTGSIQLRSETVTRAGIRATRIDVDVPEGGELPHRGLPDVLEVIGKSSLSERVKERAGRIFTRLAEAEAVVHGVPVEKVHFHEVGALDAIADVVGAVCGIERLGVGKVLFSALRLGGGTVKAAHGTLPVPAPATARLIEGFRCESGPIDHELLTPTAAAILTTLGEQAPLPPFTMEATGYGAGAGDHPEHPNVLRAMLGSVQNESGEDTVWMIEANIDDATPQVIGHTLEQLLHAGALDAWAAPIQMKKLRPGIMLCALASDEDRMRIEEVFFHETPTFGIRRHRVARTKLDRKLCPVETEWGTINVKLGILDSKVITVAPEYDDCCRIALEYKMPLRNVMNLARRTYHQTTKEAAS